jgi:hypothetical protein
VVYTGKPHGVKQLSPALEANTSGSGILSIVLPL